MNSLVRVSPMRNTSGLRPLGHAVLIEPTQSELATDKIIIPDNIKERSMMVEMYGIVIAVGSEAWLKENRPRAHVGDKVMVSRWCGHICQGPADGKMYRMVNAEDVFCQVVEEKVHGTD